MPVRVKKTRQSKNPETRSDLIGTELALGMEHWGKTKPWFIGARSRW